MLRTHVAPRRGQLPIDRVNAGHIESLYVELRSAGVSLSSVHAIHIAVRQVIKFALRREWLEVDPMLKVTRPGGSKRARIMGEGAIRYWTAVEQRGLFST